MSSLPAAGVPTSGLPRSDLPASGPRGPRFASWRFDAAVVAVVAVVLRLPALFAARHLTFDDGQYGAVILGLRAGELPFRDLFSSQGPLYYPLLGVADLVGLRTMSGARILPIAAGAVATVATYAIARHLGRRGAALLAALLVATSGSLLYVTGPLSGDGPALALALSAVALALRFRARPSTARALAVGVAMGAAIGVKLIVAPVAIPVGLLLLGFGTANGFGTADGGEAAGRGFGTGVRQRLGRGLGALGTAVGAAVAVLLAAALPWGLQRVWDQSVAYHQDSQRLRSYGGNLTTLLQTLGERDPFLVLVVLMASALTVRAALGHRRSGVVRAPDPAARTAAVPASLARWLVLPWLGLQGLFLVVEPTMWRPHVAQIIAPLALTVVLLRVPSWRVAALGCVVLAPWWVLNVHDILWPSAYPHAEAAVVARLRALPADALVISDDPGLAWRADRRVPANFVDVSMKRFQQGQLDTAVVGRAAHDPAVCAVLVWSPERLGSLDALPRRLRVEGFRITSRYPGGAFSDGPGRVLYQRRGCAPPPS